MKLKRAAVLFLLLAVSVSLCRQPDSHTALRIYQWADTQRGALLRTFSWDDADLAPFYGMIIEAIDTPDAEPEPDYLFEYINRSKDGSPIKPWEVFVWRKDERVYFYCPDMGQGVDLGPSRSDSLTAQEFMQLLEKQ